MEKIKTIRDAIRGLNQALTLIDLASEATGRGTGGREVSLAKTNCQQARHWLRDAADLVEEEIIIEQGIEEERQATCQALHPGKTCEEYHAQFPTNQP